MTSSHKKPINLLSDFFENHSTIFRQVYNNLLSQKIGQKHRIIKEHSK